MLRGHIRSHVCKIDNARCITWVISNPMVFSEPVLFSLLQQTANETELSRSCPSVTSRLLSVRERVCTCLFELMPALQKSV